MIVRTKYGAEIETDDFKGYGQFKKYVNDHFDKDWGKDTSKETKTYTITFCKTANVYARKEIEAYNEEDARGQAEKMLRDVRQDFDCMRDACRKYNLTASNLSFACGKENKTFAGYHWKYIAPADDWTKV